MRKKVFLSSFVCCLIVQTNAQIFNNTIVNDNSSWAILGQVVCPECPVWTQYVYFDGDSIVASNSYKKVFSCEDKLHENVKYEGLIREQNKKTYFIPANSETEYLLYDFSLEEGMSFEYVEPQVIPEYEFTVSFYVKKVDFIEINGVQLKQIQFTELPPYDDVVRATWIEKIGSLDGFFYPCGMLNPGVKRELLCYFQNDELFYKNSNYSECYYDNPEDITSVQTVVIDDCSIYPNPVDDILTVFSSNNTISLIEIFDVSGKKVYSQTYRDTINVSSFSKGLYLLKIYDANKQISSFKIIKK
jgi:hypothetical protein